MYKFLKLIVSLFLVSALTGCGLVGLVSSRSAPSSEDSTASSPEALCASLGSGYVWERNQCIPVDQISDFRACSQQVDQIWDGRKCMLSPRVECDSRGSAWIWDERGRICRVRTFADRCRERSDSIEIEKAMASLKKLVNSDDCEEAYRKLAERTELDLSNLGLQNIEPLIGLDRLRKVVLDGNKLSTLEPLTYLRNLQVVSARGNEISSIRGIGSLALLEQLFLGQNKVSSLDPIENLTGLRVLDISHNEVESLAPLAKLKALESLVVEGNKIQDVSGLESLNNLVKLTLSSNNISSIESIGPMAKLEVLELKGNRLTSLDGVSEELSSLQILLLDGNQIGDLEPLAGVKSLKVLSLKYNQVSDLTPLATLEHLVSIGLEGNPIDLAANRSPANCPANSLSSALRKYCGGVPVIEE